MAKTNNNQVNPNERRKPGGLAATFDLTAYKDYMIARVKKTVNHARRVESMRKRNIFAGPLLLAAIFYCDAFTHTETEAKKKK